MTTVLLDVDGVVMDFHSAAHRAAVRMFPHRTLLLPEYWNDDDPCVSMKLNSSESNKLKKFFDTDEFACSVTAFPDALRGVELLANHCDVAFVTAPLTTSPKWTWLRHNVLKIAFPDLDVIHTSAKWRVSGDYLVDDRPFVFEHPKKKWMPILWDASYNRDQAVPFRVNSWSSLLDLVIEGE